ncbi:MAG: hypothetical protein R3277_07790 [Brumimicrobium sp.]|nr:hypothetical protein [Brumimicrobium sp.]
MRFILILLLGVFTGCNQAEEETPVKDNEDRKRLRDISLEDEPYPAKIKVELNDEKLNFTEIENGISEGGEYTFIWAGDKSRESDISFRWARTAPNNTFKFDTVPTIVMRLKKNGELLRFTASEEAGPDDLAMEKNENMVRRIKGMIKLKPKNEAARENYPDGAKLRVNLKMAEEPESL